jgi:hypothetical protein
MLSQASVAHRNIVLLASLQSPRASDKPSPSLSLVSIGMVLVGGFGHAVRIVPVAGGEPQSAALAWLTPRRKNRIIAKNNMLAEKCE